MKISVLSDIAGEVNMINCFIVDYQITAVIKLYATFAAYVDYTSR